MKNNSQYMRKIWDQIGLTLSGLCLIHCLALPVLISMLPWLGVAFDDERVHLLFATIAIPVALIALIPGFLKHRLKHVLLLGLTGIMLLLLGSVGHELVGHDNAHWLTVCGGFVLISAHLMNYKTSRNLCNKPLQ